MRMMADFSGRPALFFQRSKPRVVDIDGGREMSFGRNLGVKPPQFPRKKKNLFAMA